MSEPFPFQEAHNAIVAMLHDYLAEKEHAERLEEENARLRASSFVTAVPSEEYERSVKQYNSIIDQHLAENARLKAEVEKFKFTLEEERQISRQDWAGLRCEHDRLKRALEQAEAEVERLRKAGDAMYAYITDVILEGRISSPYLNKLQDDWDNAAKDGKPTA